MLTHTHTKLLTVLLHKHTGKSWGKIHYSKCLQQVFCRMVSEFDEMRNNFVGGSLVLNKWMSLSTWFLYFQDGCITRARAGHEKTFGSEASTIVLTPSFTFGFKRYGEIWVMVSRFYLTFNRFCSNYFPLSVLGTVSNTYLAYASNIMEKAKIYSEQSQLVYK